MGKDENEMQSKFHCDQTNGSLFKIGGTSEWLKKEEEPSPQVISGHVTAAVTFFKTNFDVLQRINSEESDKQHKQKTGFQTSENM